MSVPEHILDLKAIEKPFLKFHVGDIVYLITDQQQATPMLIVDYELEDDNCNDYYCKWLNTKGEIECEALPEECVSIKK